jgi:hypothetical protein
MAAITTSALWLPAATIGAYLAADDQAKEPRSAAITTAAATAGGVVTLTNAGLVAGTQYRAIGSGPDGATRAVAFKAE